MKKTKNKKSIASFKNNKVINLNAITGGTTGRGTSVQVKSSTGH
jgi:hypothetical protein